MDAPVWVFSVGNVQHMPRDSMRWTVPPLDRAVLPSKVLPLRPVYWESRNGTERLFSLAEMVLVFQNETRPNLAPSTLIGPFCRDREGLGLSGGD
jgi:hypothetical protein